MYFQFSSFGLHMLICSLILLGIIGYAFKHRENKIRKFLFANSIVTFIYVFAYAIYCFLIPADLKVVCLCVEFVVYVLTYTFMLLICFEFFDNDVLYKRRNLILLSIVPIFTLICALTDPWTNLIATPIYNTGAVEGITFVRGIGGWLTFAYGFILYAVIIGYCAIKYPSLNRKKKFGALLIMLSPILSIISLISLLTGIFNNYTNYIPLSCFITTVLLFIAVYFTHTFDKSSFGRKGFIDNVSIGMIFIDLDNFIVDYNNKFSDELEGFKENVRGHSLKEFENQIFVKKYYETDNIIEYYNEVKNRWFEIEKIDVFEEDEKIGTVCTVTDISRNKSAEKEAIIHAKKADKAAQEAIAVNNQNVLLLKEVHHRVKNNLQLVTSFINLEKRFNKDNPNEIIAITQKRIDSLAVIHERIYNEEDMTNIHMKSFLDDFIKSLYSLSDGLNIEFKDETPENLLLSVDTVTPLVLIFNELITNTLKYAFDEEHDGPKEVHTSTKYQKIDGKLYCEVKYRDTGKGLPNDFDINKLTSLGMIVIKELSGQLDGEFTFFNDNGCNFTLIFPVKEDLTGYI